MTSGLAERSQRIFFCLILPFTHPPTRRSYDAPELTSLDHAVKENGDIDEVALKLTPQNKYNSLFDSISAQHVVYFPCNSSDFLV
jgi:hypothetical protein